MTYKQNFVATIKVSNQILRERDGAFYLPFGSEYSIYLKNLESRRVQVNVSIDGLSIGGTLVMNGNSSIDLERFLENNNLSGHRFKFIQKTEQISKHRGDRIDDGLIRVEFAFEKRRTVTIHEDHVYYHHHHEYPWIKPHIYWKYEDPYHLNTCKQTGDSSLITSGYTGPTGYTRSVGFCLMNSSEPLQDEGITVPGSRSNQIFQCVSGFDTDQSEVMTLVLRGELRTVREPHIRVIAPITVKHKLECPTCGKKSKSNINFCPSCGTALI